jgi:hypothetical protein
MGISSFILALAVALEFGIGNPLLSILFERSFYTYLAHLFACGIGGNK